MKRLLIVEDQSADLRVAVDIVKSLGVPYVEARTSTSAAKVYLETALNQKQPLPDLIIVDLDLGYESGFELLRFWHGNPSAFNDSSDCLDCHGRRAAEHLPLVQGGRCHIKD